MQMQICNRKQQTEKTETMKSLKSQLEMNKTTKYTGQTKK